MSARSGFARTTIYPSLPALLIALLLVLLAGRIAGFHGIVRMIALLTALGSLRAPASLRSVRQLSWSETELSWQNSFGRTTRIAWREVAEAQLEPGRPWLDGRAPIWNFVLRDQTRRRLSLANFARLERGAITDALMQVMTANGLALHTPARP